MGFQTRFTFRDKRGVTHEVSGREFRFYPNRLALLTQARDLSEPIARAVNTLFTDESRDSGTSVKKQHDGDFYMEDIVTQPIDESMAKYRAAARDGAIQQIMGTLADKRSLNLLGALFMDSLREEFPYSTDRPTIEVEDFLYGEPGAGSDEYQGLDLPALVDMFKGWMLANAKVFGDAGEKMVGAVRKRLEDLQSFDSETTPPTNGDSSKTPSSPQLVTDSERNTSTD